MQADSDQDFIKSITPDVIESLHRSGFFAQLDDLLCPKDASSPKRSCSGNHDLSKRILQSSGFDARDLADIFGVLQSLGGFCDCEILYNVTEEHAE